MTNASFHDTETLAGRLSEELVYRFLRIVSDDEPFLMWPRFTFLALRFWFLWHLLVVLSRLVESLVPEPGIGPGCTVGARGCKPRLSASSSTRAHHTGTVVSVPVITYSERYVIVAYWRRLPLVVNPSIFLFPL